MNWKTTFFGVVTAFFGFIVFAPEHFQSMPWLIDLAKYAAAGGLLGLGFSAADAKRIR